MCNVIGKILFLLRLNSSMNKKSFVFATFLGLSTLLTSGTAFAQSVQTTTLPAPYQNYYQFNSDCNLGTRTLKVGSKGRYVWTLESLINLDRGLRGLPELIADGNYNSVTKNAVRDMQEGILELDGTGIVDTETREALVDFCFQYVGRNVPRIIQHNDWNYNNRDQAFINKFNLGNFSQPGFNKMKTGQPYVFQGQPMPWTCPIGMNCPAVVRYESSLGIRLEDVTSEGKVIGCGTSTMSCTTYLSDAVLNAKLYLVLLDSNGQVVKKVNKTLSLDTNATTNYSTSGNWYNQKSSTQFGNYRITLQEKYGESGVILNVQNISNQYPVIYN